MRITQGPMLERFASVFDIPVDEVVEWVSNYVNHPEMFKRAEATEKERFASIKRYVEWRISQSSDHRIKQSIDLAKQEAA